ncbi:hypothetical protein J2W92_004482 [Rhizobium leguminosarum]
MADGVKPKPNRVARNWSEKIIRREQSSSDGLKLVKTIRALFQNGHIVGYVSWESSKPLTEETT